MNSNNTTVDSLTNCNALFRLNSNLKNDYENNNGCFLLELTVSFNLSSR